MPVSSPLSRKTGSENTMKVAANFRKIAKHQARMRRYHAQLSAEELHRALENGKWSKEQAQALLEWQQRSET